MNLLDCTKYSMYLVGVVEGEERKIKTENKKIFWVIRQNTMTHKWTECRTLYYLHSALEKAAGERWAKIHLSTFACVCVCVCTLGYSVMSNSAAPWTVVSQAPLPMEFSMEEPWSGLPFPTPGDLPDPWIESASLVSPALARWFFIPSPT